MPVWPLARVIRVLRSEHVLKNSRRIVLPVVLPRCRLGFIRRVNSQLASWAGQLLGRFLQPGVILGETHNAWNASTGAWRASPDATLVMDLHGAVPEEIRFAYPDTSWHRANVAHVERIEAQIMAQSPFVICQSPTMITHLVKKYPQSRVRMVAFQCGVDTGQFAFNPQGRKDVRDEIGLRENDPLFVYCGSLAKWQLLDRALQLFHACRQYVGSSARMLILTPAKRSAVNELVRSCGLTDDMVAIRAVRHHEVPRFLSAGDVAFLLREDTLLNRVASPTKLGEYLACGLPVITSPVARHWPSWDDGQECFHVIPDDRAPSVAELVRFVQEVKASPEKFRGKCRDVACRRHSRDLDVQALTAQVMPYLFSRSRLHENLAVG
jgi:glycosyltransferase involved in cell wall biosynthesis